MQHLPSDALGAIAPFLSHADARCLQASCRLLREYWTGVGLRMHPWIRAVPWCHRYLCKNRRLVARVEPLCIRRDPAAPWHLALCLLWVPFLYTIGVLVLPISAIVLSRSPGHTLAHGVVQYYWHLETMLLQPLLCPCPRQMTPPSLAILLYKEVHDAEGMHHRYLDGSICLD